MFMHTELAYSSFMDMVKIIPGLQDKTKLPTIPQHTRHAKCLLLLSPIHNKFLNFCVLPCSFKMLLCLFLIFFTSKIHPSPIAQIVQLVNTYSCSKIGSGFYKAFPDFYFLFFLPQRDFSVSSFGWLSPTLWILTCIIKLYCSICLCIFVFLYLTENS